MIKHVVGLSHKPTRLSVVPPLCCSWSLDQVLKIVFKLSLSIFNILYHKLTIEKWQQFMHWMQRLKSPDIRKHWQSISAAPKVYKKFCEPTWVRRERWKCKLYNSNVFFFHFSCSMLYLGWSAVPVKSRLQRMGMFYFMKWLESLTFLSAKRLIIVTIL